MISLQKAETRSSQRSLFRWFSSRHSSFLKNVSPDVVLRLLAPGKSGVLTKKAISLVLSDLVD